MYYTKTINVNGVDCNHHQVERIELSSDGTMLGVFLSCWPSEAARVDGHRPAGQAYVNGLLPPTFKAVLDQVVQGSELMANAVPTVAGGLTLDALKAHKWAEVKAHRQAAEHGGFEVAGLGVYDSDPVSQTKIIGAALAAQMAIAKAEPFSLGWTRADESIVTLNAAQMIAVGMALMAHVDQVHQVGRSLRDLIAAANDEQDLAAIAWP